MLVNHSSEIIPAADSNTIQEFFMTHLSTKQNLDPRRTGCHVSPSVATVLCPPKGHLLHGLKVALCYVVT